MNPFQTAFCALDSVLTAKLLAGVAQQYHHQPATIALWVAAPHHGIWYLSDRGYSRVAIDFGTRKLFLTANSTAQVRSRWESALSERAAVEALLAAEETSFASEIPLR